MFKVDPLEIAAGEPRYTWLRRILKEGPEARRRLAQAVAGLLGAVLITIAAFGILLIWHLVRRGRLIQESLSPPRDVRMPTMIDNREDAHDQDQGQTKTA